MTTTSIVHNIHNNECDCLVGIGTVQAKKWHAPADGRGTDAKVELGVIFADGYISLDEFAGYWGDSGYLLTRDAAIRLASNLLQAATGRTCDKFATRPTVGLLDDPDDATP